MPTYTQQQLEERYQKLPGALKEAMFNADVADKIFEVGKNHGLTIEKVGLLGEEVGYLILGLTRPAEFAQVLADRLDMNGDEARSTASEVNHQIFFPLREELKKTHDMDVREEEFAKAEVVTRPKEELKESLVGPALRTVAPPEKPKPPEAPPRPPEKPVPPPIPPAPVPKIHQPGAPNTGARTPQETLAPRPIDLRPTAKPPTPGVLPHHEVEKMRGAIFAAPAAPIKKPGETMPPAEEKPVEKKAPPRGYDLYREPVE